jgi:AraC-like DNA-binding protein
VNRYFVVPRTKLQAYVDRLWGWESTEQISLPPLLPGTGAELMIHYGQPAQLRSRQLGLLKLGAAYLLCARRGPHFAQARAGLGFISIRFRSGALRHFCPRPLSELGADALPIGELWGEEGNLLAEQVAQASSREERVAIIEHWLLACLARYGKTQPAIELALHRLYYRHQDVRVEALVEQIGMSRRNFERVFREEVGITPKAFQRVARFNQTVRELLLRNSVDYLGVALDHGYYDQAHFIHDFQNYVGETPATFLESRMRSAHFYNAPIFTPDTVPVPR